MGIFNDDPPADYKAHSLSVSDVVIMNQNGDMKAYFVDRFGFQELPDFGEERKKILGMERDIQKKDVLEQTSCISFYAAECSEFPVLGEVHHDLSLPEALEVYEKIPAERMNGLKSVGFNLQEGSDYDGMMDLMVAGRSQREILDSIPFYRENKLVQEALKRVRENQTKRRKRRDTENQISKKKGGYELMSKVTFEEDELAVVALFQENTRKDTIDILKDTSKKKGGYELMSKVTFEEDELAVVALFQENTRKDTIDILKDTLEALEETKEDLLEDDLLEIIASAISKLQLIEDKYYYSLDLNCYLNNLEDDAYEE